MLFLGFRDINRNHDDQTWKMENEKLSKVEVIVKIWFRFDSQNIDLAKHHANYSLSRLEVLSIHIHYISFIYFISGSVSYLLVIFGLNLKPLQMVCKLCRRINNPKFFFIYFLWAFA